MSDQYIELKGVRVNNLKNISLKIGLNQLVVMTGVSGSGKSSLAFDTLYAEGQRRYVESLSAYARQFLGRLNKPECDFIRGIPPAIAIEQKVNTSNPRSTVGTSTEIYDYLKLLYARAGKTISPISGREVKRHHTGDVIQYALSFSGQTAVVLARPEHLSESDVLKRLMEQGFVRLKVKDAYFRIDDVLRGTQTLPQGDDVYLVISRITINQEADVVSRISEAVETAFYEGNGECFVDINGEIRSFSNRFEEDGMRFTFPDINMFNFNSPLGACPKCEGYGKVLGIDEDLVIPNKALSVYENAVMCWRGEKMSEWKEYLIRHAHKAGFPVHTPYCELSDKEKDMLWNGCEHFEGIHDFFNYLETKRYKIQNRVMIARYTGKTTCPVCHGTRLKPEATYVKISGKSLPELVEMPIHELRDFFHQLTWDTTQTDIMDRILPEIQNRLEFLMEVGLGYLTLNRLSSTLSGGESQRINLATSLGSALVGSLYILDEPSIGLHPRDTYRLIQVLRKLRDLGNTVIIVEHDEEIIKAADEIIDIGPLAGRLGGEVVFQGDLKKLQTADTLTADYVFGKRAIETPTVRRPWNKKITLCGATENNLKNVTVDFPLHVMTVVTGVSGSGKSTLIKSILVPALKKHLGETPERIGSYDKLTGDLSQIAGIEFIDQNPIGKSSRSNPVTYLKIWDDIRKLFAETQAAKLQGFRPSYFSFNVPGGRCEECQGDGVIKVEMQFMADLYLKCEHCKGRRFKDDVLEIVYREKNIHDILEMTVNQALEFFSQENNTYERDIIHKLQKLADVGLGYIKLGQSSSTLSGGETQRVKLAYYLSRENVEPTIFIFDEPTTGLHIHDIHKLVHSLNALIERGHTVIIIEHNMDVVKCADHVIDLGPEGGEKGGNVLFVGTPEELIQCHESYTGHYLKEKLNVLKHEENH